MTRLVRGLEACGPEVWVGAGPEVWVGAGPEVWVGAGPEVWVGAGPGLRAAPRRKQTWVKLHPGTEVKAVTEVSVRDDF